MDHKSLRVTQNAYFSLMTHTKQLFLVIFCDKTEKFVMEQDVTWQAVGRTDRCECWKSYVDALSISQDKKKLSSTKMLVPIHFLKKHGVFRHWQFFCPGQIFFCHSTKSILFGRKDKVIHNFRLFHVKMCSLLVSNVAWSLFIHFFSWFPDCDRPWLIGNNVCDDITNRPECGFDGGDCCNMDADRCWFFD